MNTSRQLTKVRGLSANLVYKLLSLLWISRTCFAINYTSNSKQSVNAETNPTLTNLIRDYVAIIRQRITAVNTTKHDTIIAKILLIKRLNTSNSGVMCRSENQQLLTLYSIENYKYIGYMRYYIIRSLTSCNWYVVYSVTSGSPVVRRVWLSTYNAEWIIQITKDIKIQGSKCKLQEGN